jgi:hypothetical protein
MRSFTLAIAAAAALAQSPTFGAPIDAADQAGIDFILDVQFWGTEWTRPVVGGPRVFGDPVHGTMHVDARLAPPDSDPSPAAGNWFYNEPCCGPRRAAPSDFVTSDWQTLHGETEDHYGVSDRIPTSLGLTDGFSVTNSEFGPGQKDFSTLFVSISTTKDIVDGGGLLQQFESRPIAEGGYSNGTFDQTINGVYKQVLFVVDRLRVTAKVCRR